jgi:hypothetical protein
LPQLSPAFRTRRLLALTLRDLRRLATGPIPRAPGDWEGRICGRLAALPDAAEPLQRSQLMAALAVGSEIIQLRHIATRLGLGSDLDAALEALARGNRAIATTRRGNSQMGSEDKKPEVKSAPEALTPRAPEETSPPKIAAKADDLEDIKKRPTIFSRSRNRLKTPPRSAAGSGSSKHWSDRSRVANCIAGRSILAQIEEAASRCNAGIFLFTKDDDLVDNGQPDTSAPRDNVVFEAGYFIGLRGKRNVLIVREQGSKMPADLGGDIYALLPDKVDIGPIERVVSGFMAAL